MLVLVGVVIVPQDEDKHKALSLRTTPPSSYVKCIGHQAPAATATHPLVPTHDPRFACLILFRLPHRYQYETVACDYTL